MSTPIALALLGLLIIAGHRFFAWGMENRLSEDQVNEKVKRRLRQFYLGLGLAVLLAALMMWVLGR